jgi:hypothetical protein
MENLITLVDSICCPKVGISVCFPPNLHASKNPIEVFMRLENVRVPHEAKAQERWKERYAESKQIERLQQLLQKKLQECKMPAHAESTAQVA